MRYTEHPLDLDNRIRAHKLFSKATLESIIRATLDDLREGPLLLDLGCGNGNYFELLSSTASRYIGVDVNENLLKDFARKFDNRQVLIRASMDAMPEFADGTFDAIYAIYSIYYTEKPAELVASLHRFLRGDGHLVILGPGTAVHAPEISAFVEHATTGGGQPGATLVEPKNKHIRIDRFHAEIIPLVREQFRDVRVSEIDTSLVFPDSAEWATYVVSTPEVRERLPDAAREELAAVARQFSNDAGCRAISKSMLSVVARK